MIGRGRDAIPSSRPRRKPGWWRWHAGRPRSWVIPMSCGPPGCSPRLPVNTDRPPGLRLGKLARGTVCKILAEHEVKPHKVRCCLERRDPEFEPKMAEILCVCRQVAMLRRQAESGESQGEDSGGSLAIVSYDEKPGIQAIAMTAPDRPPL